MQGHPDVLFALNKLLVDELAARDQYFIHSEMLLDWGYHKVAARIAHESEDEAGHSKALIQRILMLGGTPTMRPSDLSVGSDVPSIYANDLAVEYSVIANLRSAMALCETHGDYVSRDLLCGLLRDTEEDHAHWLEQQLGLIKAIGLPNYLQSQMG